MDRWPTEGPPGVPQPVSRNWRLVVALVVVALVAPLLVAKFVAPAWIQQRTGDPIPVDDRWHQPQEFLTESAVFLAPVVRFERIDLEELAKDLEHRYGVPIEVRPAIQVESADVDIVRNELDAEAVLRALRRSYTASTPIGGDRWPVVIGLTEFDISSPTDVWGRTSAAVHDPDLGYAVVSTADLEPGFIDRLLGRDTVEEQVRRLVAWNIAVLYLDLPPDTDPDSVPRQVERSAARD